MLPTGFFADPPTEVSEESFGVAANFDIVKTLLEDVLSTAAVVVFSSIVTEVVALGFLLLVCRLLTRLGLNYYLNKQNRYLIIFY